ncbi:MAG: aminotransferase class V-fold PLP-dependent enzyme [Clostridia bacterium]|nr:aminotransferase class V-fold PLP-dependent enzyme [Clostridia bacterium]
MNTPIYDFVRSYAASDISRFHMPGHKGVPLLGCEPLDITEIAGADELFEAEGIILESEKNAAALFGTAHSFYSTEGSTLAIKSMLSLVTAKARSEGKKPLIFAARNAHKAFIYACALLDLEVRWLYGNEAAHLCVCRISAEEVESALSAASEPPSALYLTSPDYLGNIADIEGIARVCHAYGVPLVVDNAHGAYLKFLTPSRHPIDLGADICCDSAHKTLPCLTGGAYLHISKNAEREYLESARETMAIFASTSPSYLILQSLDLCNRYMSEGYSERLATCADKLKHLKEKISALGFSVERTEPLKLVINTAKSGYSGVEFAEHLRLRKAEAEFADGEFVVLMATPETKDSDLDRLYSAIAEIKPKAPLSEEDLPLCAGEPSELSIREAVFAPSETVRADSAVGRVCGAPTVSCPPAVPIVVSGERITRSAAALLSRYGVEYIRVVK